MSINGTIQNKEDKTPTLIIKDGSETNFLITKKRGGKKKRKRKEKKKKRSSASLNIHNNQVRIK